jgi:tetratricopeptide (TPR) repeat protein
MLCWGLLSAQPEEQVVACTAVIEAGGDVMKLSAAHCSRGTALQARGHLDRAIADYDQSVKLNPNSAVGRLCRAHGNYARNAFDAAIADFNEAIALDPNSAPAFLGRGVAYRAKGDIDHAIADYDESIRLNPGEAMAFNNRGSSPPSQMHLWLGEVYSSLKGISSGQSRITPTQSALIPRMPPHTRGSAERTE